MHNFYSFSHTHTHTHTHAVELEALAADMSDDDNDPFGLRGADEDAVAGLTEEEMEEQRIAAEVNLYLNFSIELHL